MKTFTIFALERLLAKERALSVASPPVVVNVDLSPLAEMLASQTLRTKDVDGVRPVPT